jgi:hypothetical protein
MQVTKTSTTEIIAVTHGNITDQSTASDEKCVYHEVTSIHSEMLEFAVGN